MIVANLTRDAQNYPTDNYILVNDRHRIETLVYNAINEYNKEKPKINFPLYSVRSSFLIRFCHLNKIFFSATSIFSADYVTQFKQWMVIAALWPKVFSIHV